MSLQSPFGSDINAQLLALQASGATPTPYRDPGDMGTREQFMRMLDFQRSQMNESRAAEERANQRQIEAEQRLYDRQKEVAATSFARETDLLKMGARQQMAVQENQAYLNQQAKERFMAQQQQLDMEEDAINDQIAIATGDERIALEQRLLAVKQKNEQMKTAITQAEAKAAGLGSTAKVQQNQLRTQFETMYNSLQSRLDDGITRGGTMDIAGLLGRVVQGSRLDATGGAISGGGIPGIASYSDLHFASQDPKIAAALAAFVDAPTLDAWGKSVGEGGIVGMLGRTGEWVSRGAGSLFGMKAAEGSTATVADRLKAAQEATTKGSKSAILGDLLADSFAQQLGLRTEEGQGLTSVKGLLSDAEMLRVAMSSGDPDRVKIVKDRMKSNLTNVAAASGLSEEGLIQFFKTAAQSMKEGPKNEKGVAAPRFGEVTNQGTNQDIVNALGKGMANELSNLSDVMGTVFRSGEIQRASDYKRVVEAMTSAFQPSGPGGEVTMDEKMLNELLRPLFSNAQTTFNLGQGEMGRMTPEQFKIAKDLFGTLADLSGTQRGIAGQKEQMIQLLSDPANAALMDPQLLDLQARLAGQRAGAMARGKRKPLLPTPPPFERPKV